MLVKNLIFSSLFFLFFVCKASANLDLQISNNNSPIDISASKLEILNKENQVILTGNVILTQDKISIYCNKLVLYYYRLKNKGNKLKIDSVIATENVVIKNNEEEIYGDVATYEVKKGKIIISKNVVIKKKNNKISGDILFYDINTGLAELKTSNNNNDRVKGTLNIE